MIVPPTCSCVKHFPWLDGGCRTGIMNFHNQTGHVVGADLSCTSPIYRPGEGIDEPLADNEF